MQQQKCLDMRGGIGIGSHACRGNTPYEDLHEAVPQPQFYSIQLNVPASSATTQCIRTVQQKPLKTPDLGERVHFVKGLCSPTSTFLHL